MIYFFKRETHFLDHHHIYRHLDTVLLVDLVEQVALMEARVVKGRMAVMEEQLGRREALVVGRPVLVVKEPGVSP